MKFLGIEETGRVFCGEFLTDRTSKLHLRLKVNFFIFRHECI